MLGPAHGHHFPEKTLLRTRMGDWWKYEVAFRAKCTCGAERDVPMGSILKMFGQEHQFDEPRDIPRLARALVCGSCGRKGQATVRLVQPGS
jgi:hypothetical protein